MDNEEKLNESDDNSMNQLIIALNIVKYADASSAPNIKWKYILLTYGYIKKGASTCIPQDICKLILFYFSKPLRLKLECNYSSITKSILYFPVDDGWKSMIHKIQQQFNGALITGLKYNEQIIDEYNWARFWWDESEVLTIHFHSKECEFDDHLLISEAQYVQELEVIIEYISKPLQQLAEHCKISGGEDSVVRVFECINNMHQFHQAFSSVVGEQKSVLQNFHKFMGFLQLYHVYLLRYDEIIELFSTWNSYEFREFIKIKLGNHNVKNIIDSRLSHLPWYLYRPFERIKQYYRWLMDLYTNSTGNIDDDSMIVKAKIKCEAVCNKIKQQEQRLQQKTKLAEINLQVIGYPTSLVNDNRIFVHSVTCETYDSILSWIPITIYLFTDMIIWTSKNGNFKGIYNFKDVGLKVFITENDAVFTIILKNDKRLIKCADNQKTDKLMNLIKKTYKEFALKSELKHDLNSKR